MNKKTLVLEIGGGTHPQLGWLDDTYDVVNVDISAPLLELGSLLFGYHLHKHNVGFVCCDATDPPFVNGAFDVIVMFAALHHFAEPELLLRQLAKLLKPSGILAALCEPVGNSLEHTDTVRDLLSGINEQVFSLHEYAWIFRQAGLRPVWWRVDGASSKAILMAA